MVKTYIFSGRVLPEWEPLSTTQTTFSNTHPGTGIKFHADVRIGFSQISAKVELQEGKAEPFTFKSIVEESIRAIVDAYGYCHGKAYDIDIFSCLEPEGLLRVYGSGVKELEESTGNRPVLPNAVIEAFSKSAYLPIALADLRESIRSGYTGLFCFRAIESIRQHFHKPEDGEHRAKSWERLRKNLNISEDWIKAKIEKYSVPQRHGDDLFMSGKEKVDVIQDTWKVMDRFCYFLIHDSKPLDEKVWHVLE